jgi:hypothetical protein
MKGSVSQRTECCDPHAQAMKEMLDNNSELTHVFTEEVLRENWRTHGKTIATIHSGNWSQDIVFETAVIVSGRFVTEVSWSLAIIIKN